jgi:hypothetical protein
VDELRIQTIKTKTNTKLHKCVYIVWNVKGGIRFDQLRNNITVSFLCCDVGCGLTSLLNCLRKNNKKSKHMNSS